MALKFIKDGGVTSPAGFLASGMHGGIKPLTRKYDCSLIVSEKPAVSAAVFTVNKAKAWPLLYNQSIIRKPKHRAILANSGNANCFNGKSGAKAIQSSLKLLSSALKIKKREALLASTGIIGKPFPIEKLEAAIPLLVGQLSKSGGIDAARGILTTDTYPKEIAVQFRVGSKKVTLGAMAKGAGMVLPHMTPTGERHATMLCFVTTDLAISKPMLTKALADAVDRTFNHIAIDNDMSTNDMVVVLANGLAKNDPITHPGKSFEIFKQVLTRVCSEIARALVKDGEGVKHVCEIHIQGAKTRKEAKLVGKQIATSMLVKTMLAGEDPNWGRVVASIGASGAQFSKNLDVAFDGVYILKNGKGLFRNRPRVRKVLQKKEFVLQVNLKKGSFEETFFTSDLTKFYVWINSSYSS